MTQHTKPDPQRCFVRILDEVDSPQRYPLIPLLDAVRDVVDPEQQNWRVSGMWGQGFKTARLQDAERDASSGELRLSTEVLVDLDDDPNEWFFDVIIRTSDRSLSFGIFDSGCMFVEGPRDLALQIGQVFEQVTEHDSSSAPPAIRGEV